MKRKLVVLLFVAGALIAPLPSQAQNCTPPGYTHSCASFCSFCENFGGCCRGFACGDPEACAQYYEMYCLQTTANPGCHDGMGDGCCEGGSGLF